MPNSETLAQALAILPGLILVWATLYAVYWLLGIVNFPKLKRREDLLNRLGSVDTTSLGPARRWRLALISLISLFLELLLIRWVTSEIRIFAYFQSMVLIACFLGFGLGAYLTKRRIYLAYTLVPLLALVFMIELPWDSLRLFITNLSAFIGWFSDVHIWSRAYFETSFAAGALSAAIAMSVVIPLFGLVAITFIPLGQFVGWYLENSKDGIGAYSVNIIASIAGIWLFTALSFYSTPPMVWFAFFALGMVVFFWRLPRLRVPMVAAFVLMLALFGLGSMANRWWGEQSWKGSLPSEYTLTPGEPQVLWSPYQKLTLIPLSQGGEVARYILNTNDSWYQQIMDLSPAAVAKTPELFTKIPAKYFQYNLPYQFFQNPPSVLIVGAGMGNDAASALRNGAGHVTAVEIDPLIYEEGKRLHFEQPYQSDRVDLQVDDARAYIQNSKSTYDLIVFSILDSQTTSSSYTNIRLDNYVYTLEAMQATRKLLKPDGLLVLSFSSERPWFTTRLRDVVTKAFGKPPLMVQTNVSFFVAGSADRIDQAMAANPELKDFVATHSDIQLEDADPITDDWPYLYQQFRGIPIIVVILSIGLIGTCWLAFKRMKGVSGGLQWHFFFLGAAFTLLEVQIISKIALLFGTTWLVNSIVITTLLGFILLSNWVVARYPRLSRSYAYVGLFVAVALSYLIPTNALFFDSFPLRALAATGLYCSPAFFAGLIFISSFKEIGFRAEAFGSNLLGSLVGGLLLSLSYLLGIQALVLVSGFLYTMSLLSMGRISSPVALTANAPSSE